MMIRKFARNISCRMDQQYNEILIYRGSRPCGIYRLLDHTEFLIYLNHLVTYCLSWLSRGLLIVHHNHLLGFRKEPRRKLANSLVSLWRALYSPLPTQGRFLAKANIDPVCKQIVQFLLDIPGTPFPDSASRVFCYGNLDSYQDRHTHKGKGRELILASFSLQYDSKITVIKNQ